MFFRMKRHKTFFGASMRTSTCIYFLLFVQFPYFVFFAFQLSSASNDAPQHFKDIDFTSKMVKYCAKIICLDSVIKCSVLVVFECCCMLVMHLCVKTLGRQVTLASNHPFFSEVISHLFNLHQSFIFCTDAHCVHFDITVVVIKHYVMKCFCKHSKPCIKRCMCAIVQVLLTAQTFLDC